MFHASSLPLTIEPKANWSREESKEKGWGTEREEEEGSHNGGMEGKLNYITSLLRMCGRLTNASEKVDLSPRLLLLWMHTRSQRKGQEELLPDTAVEQ